MPQKEREAAAGGSDYAGRCPVCPTMNSIRTEKPEPLDLDAGEPFFSVPEAIDDAVIRSAKRCIELQRRVVDDSARTAPSSAAADDAVAEAALTALLDAGEDVHGIAADSSISDVVSINAQHIGDAVHNREIADLRRLLDNDVEAMLRRLLVGGRRFSARRSGHFWYKPGSHMGWHTNNRAPGWRVYLTHAAEPGRSFFRYRDPRDGRIVTTMDGDWDLRVFRVDPEAPLWHAVRSDTDRFSFGYALIRQSPVRAALNRVRNRLRSA